MPCSLFHVARALTMRLFYNGLLFHLFTLAYFGPTAIREWTEFNSFFSESLATLL
jgi:hypothetical protein